MKTTKKPKPRINRHVKAAKELYADLRKITRAIKARIASPNLANDIALQEAIYKLQWGAQITLLKHHEYCE